MKRIEFEDAQIIEDAYVEIDGVKHYVIPAQTSGGTDLNGTTFNGMQDNIEEEFGSLLKVISVQTNIATIGANSNIYDQTLDITSSIPNGYTALGIVGVMMYGAGYANTAFNRKALENNIIKYGIKNTSSTELSTLTANFKVLCIKNES